MILPDKEIEEGYIIGLYTGPYLGTGDGLFQAPFNSSSQKIKLLPGGSIKQAEYLKGGIPEIREKLNYRYNRINDVSVYFNDHNRLPFNVRFDHLKNNETKSCGCKRQEFAREAGKKEYGQAAFNDTYNSYKQGAKSRGISFNLTKEEFKNLSSKNCNYCGVVPSQIKKVKGDNGDFIYNGIDRIDSSKGYIEGNCITCCGTCNYMKRTHSIEDFANHIIKLYHNFAKNFSNGSGVLTWA